MATVARSNSRVNPQVYKDYVNFLASYKNGKKEENSEDVKSFSMSNSDSGISVKNFSLANSSNSTSSSSLSSDVTDFSKNSCASYSSFLESSKSKKFGSVKATLEEKQEDGHLESATSVSTVKQNFEEKREEKILKKSEIFIEIEPVKSVSQVSRIFENQQGRKSPPKNNKINSKISIFEKQTSIENKPKLATKPVITRSASSSFTKIELLSSKETKLSSPRIASPPPQPQVVPPPPKPEILSKTDDAKTLPPPPPPLPSTATLPRPIKTNENIPPPPPMNTVQPVKIQAPPLPSATTLSKLVKTNGNMPPPPPPPMNTVQPVKIQATLTKGPQTKYSVNGSLPNEIDRNDPLVRKLVYGTLRGLYGAYHDKANDMLATLPKNMVVRSNGVQDRIEQIAANGDLDKLNGRVNPKLDQD